MRELTRRDVLALGGSVAALAATGGCGGVLPEPDVTAAGFGDDAGGTLRFWCRAATLPASELVVSRFHEAQDDVRVVLTAVPDAQFVTKLATSIRGRSVPDLVGIDDINSLLFTTRDAFTDLEPLLEQLAFRDALSPGHLRLATLPDGVYGVPYLGDLSRMFWNRDLFERAGLDPEAPPRDFAGIVEATRAVTSLGGVKGFSFAGNCPGCLGFTMLPHVWATGTDLIVGEVGEQEANIAGNDALRALLELYRDLWADEQVPDSARTEAGATWGQDFLADEVGLFPSSYGSIVGQAEPGSLERFGATTLSGPEGGQSLFRGGDNFGIPRGASNASAAWRFVQFALDLDQQSRLPEAGYTPIRSDALTPAYRRDYPLDVVALENLGEAYAPSTLAYNATFNQVDGPWFLMVQRAIYGGDVDGALQQGQRGFSRSLEQAQL